MRAILSVGLSCLVALAPALAQDQKVERAARIARVLGLEQLLAETQRTGVETARAQMQGMLAELKNGGLPADVVEELRPSAEQLVIRAASSWSPAEATQIYAAGLVDALSEDELVEAERYYDSPQGRKANEAISNSLDNMRAYINERSSATLNAGMRAFIEDVKQAVQRSRGTRKQP